MTKYKLETLKERLDLIEKAMLEEEEKRCVDLKQKEVDEVYEEIRNTNCRNYGALSRLYQKLIDLED